MIYFDNSATTLPYSEVVETFAKVSTEYFGNPSSLHPIGKASEQLMEQARKRIAGLLNVKDTDIVFTSGGTEGNNLAVKGAAYQNRSRGNHIITTGIEHSSTYEVCRQLEKEGFSVTYLTPGKHGYVSASTVREAITDQTVLVSLIHVNNELGSIQPVEEIGSLLADYPKILFHVDHVQGVTKVPIDFQRAKVDLCTISAHKFHGLPGNGVVIVRRGIKLMSLFSGGNQQAGYRAGTENVAGIVAMAKALRITLTEAEKGTDHLRDMSYWLEEELRKIDGVMINSPAERAPHILNFSIPGLKPEVIVQALAERDVYVSTKSACSSKKNAPSRILVAAGFEKKQAESAIRLSFSFNNTKEEASIFLEELKEVVGTMKKVVKFK
ncbi:cysteine desulfurase [Salipaludibacillus sp. LMS25]|jgi:cysteine desulfurase|uniref:cysteine desulfurase family protein n=1 Tax=Salipaludibacillus sp. LMS25 TaxID=2924031 RepID=UPI0020D0CE05|nr:cysteine desulfurase family protein [Salipaludibacillus sp. LMS25]UTR15612.1 cysteine desulfurase [Salipaludibacillus sp. LMS25]